MALYFFNTNKNYYLTSNYKVWYSTLSQQENLKLITKNQLIIENTPQCSEINLPHAHYLLSRNPYQRIESFYRDKFISHPKDLKNGQHSEWQSCQKIFFPLLGLTEQSSDDEIHDTFVNTTFSKFITLLPKTYFLDGHLIPQIDALLIDTQKNYGYQALPINILQTEKQEDLTFLIEELEINADINLNSTSHIKTEIAWSKASRQIINNLYLEDFFFLGYIPHDLPNISNDILIEKTIRLLKENHNERAVKLLTLILTKIKLAKTQKAQIYNLLIKTFKSLNKYEAALSWTKYALLDFPNNIKLLINHADLLQLTNQWNDSFTVCNAINQKFPNTPPIEYLKGNYYLNKGEIQKAAELYHQAEQLDNKSLDLYINCASHYHAANFSGKSKQWIDKGLSYFPNNENLQTLLMDFFIQKKLWKKAIDSIEGKSTSNLDKEILIKKAFCLNKLKNTAKALAIIDTLKLYYPYNINIFTLEAEVFKDSNNWHDNIRVWHTALKRFPYYTMSLYHLGCGYKEIDSTEQAQDYFLKYLETNPNDIKTLQQIAQINIQKNNYIVALDYFKKAESIKKTPTLLYHIGKTYEKLNEITVATEYFQKINKNFPKAIDGWCGLAELDFKNNNIKNALSNIDMALQIEPENLRASLQAISYHLHEKNFAECWIILANLKTKYSDNSNILFTEARIYQHEFQFFKALEVYKYIEAKLNINIDSNFSYIRTLIELGYFQETSEKLLQASLQPKILENPNFFTLCASGLDKNNLTIWQQLATNILKSTLDKSFILKYINILESRSLHNQALQFLQESHNKTNQTNLQVNILSTFEKNRLNNIINISNYGLDATFFERQEKTLQEEIRITLKNRTNNKVYQWYCNICETYATLKSIYCSFQFSTYTNPINTLAIAEKIITHINNKAPFSLLRLGDGEGVYLNYTQYKEFHAKDLAQMQLIHWGKTVSSEMIAQANIIEDYLCAVENADIVGVSDYYNMLTLLNIETLDETLNKPNGNVLRGYLAVIDFFADKNTVAKEKFKSITLTSSYIHHHLHQWGLYDLIFSHIKSCSLITCHDNLDVFLEKRFSIKTRMKHIIPTEYKYAALIGNNISIPHFPDTYQQLCQTIEVSQLGEVYLVSAGFLGKIYCDLIKKRGGIAIDIGSMSDYWLSYETRGAIYLSENQRAVAYFHTPEHTTKSLQLFNNYLASSITQRTNAIDIHHYWINLEHDLKRKAFADNQFTQLNIKNTRILGVTPCELPSIKESNIKAKPTEYGCLCAHFYAMRTGLLNQQEYFIVQEDDAIIPHPIRIELLVNSAPSDWEILQLHTNNAAAIDQLSVAYMQGELWSLWSMPNTSTAMYIIKASAAQKILYTYFKNDYIDLSNFQSKPVADILIYNTVQTYTLNYPIIMTASSESNIHPEHLSSHEESNQQIKKIHLLSNKYFNMPCS